MKLLPSHETSVSQFFRQIEPLLGYPTNWLAMENGTKFEHEQLSHNTIIFSALSIIFATAG